MSGKQITGSEALLQALIHEGVDTLFGYPGGQAILFTTSSTTTATACGTYLYATSRALHTLHRDMPAPVDGLA